MDRRELLPDASFPPEGMSIANELVMEPPHAAVLCVDRERSRQVHFQIPRSRLVTGHNKLAAESSPVESLGWIEVFVSILRSARLALAPETRRVEDALHRAALVITDMTLGSEMTRHHSRQFAEFIVF